MNNKLVWAALAAVVGGTAYYLWITSRQEAEPVPTPIPSEEAPVQEAPPAAPPAILHPIEPEPVPKGAPLPSLDASDAAVGEALSQLMGVGSLPRYFYPDAMIRRFVATIDNLPRAKASARLMPVKPVPRAFAVRRIGGDIAIARENSARYRAYVGVMESVAVPQLVDIYVRFYPLFQQAYVELGYPKRYFNDRLVETIDDLLAAPEVQPPIGVVRPHVLYQFADSELEGRSAGQKIMIRMGIANSARVKRVLREIRNEIVDRRPVVEDVPAENGMGPERP